ncbi:arginyltransferase [Lysobacter soyae]|uniref:Aspartate/glutamate leucyltransferase n=1 Tax=Lysobacter soyae TaxID=2764185 RepID=A0ABX8WSE6_9GAMM|nr:arginyltransferase [Lysobacter sp. CJ11]QYR53755.1 arginyltransferase [Lysobacter sp. CJ11]
MAVDDELRIYRTGFHTCGYWKDRFARDLLLDPREPRLDAIYPLALSWGFRRSGDMVYRPDCVTCRECKAVRIPVARFEPDRAQRRCLKRNADIQVRVVAAERTDEQFDLYHRYLQARHKDGGMDDHVEIDFDRFMVSDFAQTRFIEMRLAEGAQAGRLLGVAVTDVCEEGLSAVYTFFDPAERYRSLGTFGILEQLAWARREGLPHVYLGYWIAGHPKMDYKRRFKPLETIEQGQWRDLDPEAGT